MDDDHTLNTSRVLPYAPSAVFAAFAVADVLASWWGPDGFTNTFEVFECKAGGRWKFVMHGPDGTNYPNECVFADLVPDAKVVINHVCPPYFVLTVGLTPTAGGTLITWEQTFEDSQTVQAVKPIVGPANEQNLDRLTLALAEQAFRPQSLP